MLSTKLGRRVLLVFQGRKLWRRKVRVGNLGIFLYYFKFVDLGRVVVDSGYYRKMGTRLRWCLWFGPVWLWARFNCKLDQCLNFGLGSVFRSDKLQGPRV